MEISIYKLPCVIRLLIEYYTVCFDCGNLVENMIKTRKNYFNCHISETSLFLVLNLSDLERLSHTEPSMIIPFPRCKPCVYYLQDYQRNLININQ
jgi:hypothetical protein